MATPPTRPVWPAYTIALLALFSAVGGPAYAEALITGADIKDGSVASIDLKNDSVKAVDVKNGSLTSNDLSAAAKADLSGTAGACGEGEELRWLKVALTADGVRVDQTLRIGRCLGTGEQFMGDGIVQLPEECDTGGIAGSGCSATGMLEGTPGVDFFPDGEMHYMP